MTLGSVISFTRSGEGCPAGIQSIDGQLHYWATLPPIKKELYHQHNTVHECKTLKKEENYLDFW